jgi:hypothetical protein
MRQSKILLASAKAGPRAKDIRERFGPEIIEVSTEQMIAAHKAVDEKLATETALRLFIKPAKKIVEPSRAEIVKSAKMYLAMKQLMGDNRAQAIAVNCLGGIPIQVLGYPCLGFAQLLDEGFVGACEADLDSTLTTEVRVLSADSPGGDVGRVVFRIHIRGFDAEIELLHRLGGGRRLSAGESLSSIFYLLSTIHHLPSAAGGG